MKVLYCSEGGFYRKTRKNAKKNSEIEKITEKHGKKIKIKIKNWATLPATEIQKGQCL